MKMVRSWVILCLVLLSGISEGQRCRKTKSKLNEPRRLHPDPAGVRTNLPVPTTPVKSDVIIPEITPLNQTDVIITPLIKTDVIIAPLIKTDVIITPLIKTDVTVPNPAPIIYQFNYQINYNFPPHFTDELIKQLNETLVNSTKYVIKEANLTQQTIKLPEVKADNQLPITSNTRPRILTELIPFLNPWHEPNLVEKPGLASPELISEIDYYVKFAGATYCDKSCSFCKKMDPDVEIIRITNETTKINGLVAIIPNRQEIVAAYRGSDGPVKFMGSAFAFQTPFTWVKGAYVHENFFYYMNSIHPILIKTLIPLVEKYPNYRLLITGHSLGGAIATLSAPFIYRDAKIPYSKMRIITYGQPRVGNLAFAMWYNHLDINFTRVVNGVDGVADFPSFSNDWVHVQQEVYIKNGDYFICPTTKMEHPHCSFNKLSAWGLLGSHQRVNKQSLNPLSC